MSRKKPFHEWFAERDVGPLPSYAEPAALRRYHAMPEAPRGDPDAIEEVLGECVEAYLIACDRSGDVASYEDEARVRAILLVAVNLWGIAT